MHICHDHCMFERLNAKRNFGDMKSTNGQKMKLLVLVVVQFEVYDGNFQTFHNTRYVPVTRANIISLGALTS